MVTEEQIKELAYFLWEQEDRQDDKDVEYYFRAKQMLEEQETALFSTKEPLQPALEVEPPSAPKKALRRIIKRSSKKI